MTPRKRRNRLDSLHEIADQLRQSEDVAAPDLTHSILIQVHANRAFLDRKTRNMLWVGRAMIGASVAVVVLGIALAHRWAPGAFDLAHRPAPFSTVVETVKSEATERLGGLRLVVDGATPTSAGTDERPASGGLLSLVAIAAPNAGAPSRRANCAFCGPIVPPAVAARAVPAQIANDTPVVRVTLASFKQGASGSQSDAAAFAAAPLIGRYGVRARFGAPNDRLGAVSAECRPVLQVISLNELAPLGACGRGAADSALAPK